MFGQYSQTRSRMVLAAAICSSLIWSGMAMPLPVQAQEPDPSTQLRVRSMSVAYSGGFGGARRRAVAIVVIEDGNLNPVNGAVVVGNWSGCFKQFNDSAVTETVCWYDYDTLICQDGRADIWADKFTSCWGSGKHCSFTFTITSVSKAGMTYVPVAGKTTASAPCN